MHKCDVETLREKIGEIVNKDNINYDDVYRLSLELEKIITKYYFDCA